MADTYTRSLCWLRRDLRLHDHVALYHALTQSAAVHCVFVGLPSAKSPEDKRDKAANPTNMTACKFQKYVSQFTIHNTRRMKIL